MKDKVEVWQEFWEQFGLPVFDESSVPDNSPPPRITYSLSTDSFGTPTAPSVSLWYYSSSWEAITKKADEISRAIGYGGVVLPYDGGYLWLKRGNPFAQRVQDDNDSVRRIYINLEADWLSAN